MSHLAHARWDKQPKGSRAEIELRGIELMKPVKSAVVLAATALCAGLMVPVVAAIPAVAGTNGCPPDGFFGVAHQGAHDEVAFRAFLELGAIRCRRSRGLMTGASGWSRMFGSPAT